MRPVSTAVLVLTLSVLVIAFGCSDDNYSDPFFDAFRDSYDAYETFATGAEFSDCIDSTALDAHTCVCPGGGSISYDPVDQKSTFTDCKDSSGNIFAGTIVPHSTISDEFDYDFPLFANCSGYRGSSPNKCSVGLGADVTCVDEIGICVYEGLVGNECPMDCP